MGSLGRVARAPTRASLARVARAEKLDHRNLVARPSPRHHRPRLAAPGETEFLVEPEGGEIAHRDIERDFVEMFERRLERGVEHSTCDAESAHLRSHIDA